MPELTLNSKAPAFSAPTQDAPSVSLKDFKGKKVILFFYPKDDTPGCTKEACAFRDQHSVFLKKGIVVLGVSVDPVAAHQKFAKKFSLPFPLLADVEKKIVTAYGVWVEKSMYGKKYMGVERSTFLIDETGKITAIFRKVKPETHVEEILAVL
jgi:thioredoxin-dependent peroxiredoxin